MDQIFKIEVYLHGSKQHGLLLLLNISQVMLGGNLLLVVWREDWRCPAAVANCPQAKHDTCNCDQGGLLLRLADRYYIAENWKENTQGRTYTHTRTHACTNTHARTQAHKQTQ